MKPPLDPHDRHRFPAEIISHAVWLCHVLSRNLRAVELLSAERGVVVSYETVRRWCKKFGQALPTACKLSGAATRQSEVTVRMSSDVLPGAPYPSLSCRRRTCPERRPA